MSGPFSAGPDDSNLGELSSAALRQGDADRAIELADQWVEKSGQSEPALVWALRTRLETGRFASAVQVGERSLEIRRSPAISGLLGRAYHAMGRPRKAEKHLHDASEGESDNPEWAYYRAAALIQLGRSYEAMRCLEHAVDLDPRKDALLRLANLELTFNDPEAAIGYADRSVALDAADPAGHLIAAWSHMLLGQRDSAEARWERALASGAKLREVALARANALVYQGELDEARGLFKQQMARDPADSGALTRYAFITRMSEQERPLLGALEGFARHSSSPDEQESLHYALGKSFDNLGDYDKAMGHFDEANRLALLKLERKGGFRPEELAANTRLRIEVFDPDKVTGIASRGDSCEVPIFVVGMMRSGTTLAEQILSSHPLVAGAGELDFWMSADFELIDAEAKQVNEEILRERAATYLSLLKRFRGISQRVVDKQPGNIILAGALHAAFPKARIIQMRRQPVDTAISIWTTPMTTSVMFVHDKPNIVSAYRECEKLMAHWRETLPSDRFMEVSYEELVRDRDRMTRRMIEFCGLPWSDECLSSERNRRTVATPSFWQVRQPVYTSSIDRWRNYLPWLGEFKELLES